MSLDPTAVLSAFVGTLPTFVAVVLAWTHLNSRMWGMQNSLNPCLDDTRDLLTTEFRGVEEITDARLRHLEEH